MSLWGEGTTLGEERRGRKIKYTGSDSRAEYNEYKREYYRKNKDKLKAYNHMYYKKHQKTRAIILCTQHSKADKENGTGECTLTPDFIMNSIFNSSCVYCGEKDWRKLGCDRIDNLKPHTPDNVVCSCGRCNVERGDRFSVDEFKRYKQIYPKLFSENS